MTSASQISANIANAQHSTGPVTAQGKTHSAANALKFGFYAKQAVLLTDEDHFHFDCICETFEFDLQPKTTVQHTLFNQIVLAAWNIQRSNYVEAQLAISEGADPLLSESKIIDRIHTFRHRAERSLLKLLTEFRRTKSEAQRARRPPNESGARGISPAAGAPFCASSSKVKNEPKSPPRRTQNYLVSSTYKSEPYLRPEAKVGRNEPCPCKSGRKFKQCCLQNEPNSAASS